MPEALTVLPRIPSILSSRSCRAGSCKFLFPSSDTPVAPAPLEPLDTWTQDTHSSEMFNVS